MTHKTFRWLAVCLVFAPSLIVSAHVISEAAKSQPAPKTRATAKAKNSGELDAVAAQRKVVAVAMLPPGNKW